MRRLVICTTCKFSSESKFGLDGRTGGQTLLAAVHAVAEQRGRKDIEISTQECLWNCARSCSVAIQDDQRFSYITGSNTPDVEQAEAILDWFDLHGATADGQVPFRLWPQRMRGHFIARIPPVKP